MGSTGRWISLAGGLALVGALVGGLVGCAATPSGGIQQLPENAKFDYQLGGSYTPPSGVTILTRDSTSKPVHGLYNICYVNGFQTQDDAKNFWLKQHPSLVVHVAGKPLFDPGWPNEMILDASTAAKRVAIAKVQATTIDLCKSKGFQAIEFDNLDSYSRSKHQLTLADDLALAKLYVDRAHADGLAAGQKNTTELGSRGRDVAHFDFAVAEECYKYDECGSYTKVYGARVVDIEYTDNLRGTFASDCASKRRPPMTILRDRDLVPKGNKHYVYKRC